MPKKPSTGLSKIAKAISEPKKLTLEDAAKTARQIDQEPTQSETESQLGVVDSPLPDFDPHDVVQVLDKTSKKYAQLAIIHAINGPNAACYQPRYREKPESFMCKLTDLHRIGKAHLKYKAELK